MVRVRAIFDPCVIVCTIVLCVDKVLAESG